MHLDLFKRCVAAVYTAKNNLTTCECQYFQTYANVTDHFTYIPTSLHIPKKSKKFNKRKHKKEPWMTNDLLVLINKKNV